MRQKNNWEKLVHNSKEVEKSTDGVRSDIADLQNKIFRNMPSLVGLEDIVNDIDFKGMAESLKKIAKNTI